MSTDQKIIKNRVGLLELAKQLGNVSQACNILGYSRDSFYRYKELYETGGEAAFAKLYDCKNALVAADLLNDRVVPCFEENEIPLLRVLTDRGTEYCDKREHHEYQLYLAVENIDHTKTKARSPQTNGICERFHKTILQEFYQIAMRKKIYNTIDELQADLDEWIENSNHERPHSGRYCYGKTPMGTFKDTPDSAKEKMLDYNLQTVK